MSMQWCDYCEEPHTKAQYTEDGVCKLSAFNRAKEKRFWDEIAKERAAERAKMTVEEIDREWAIQCQYGDAMSKEDRENPGSRYRYNHTTERDERMR